MSHMNLTTSDLQAISDLFDKKFDKKFDEKFDQKFDEKFAPIQKDINQIKTDLKTVDYKVDSLFDELEKRTDRLESGLAEVRVTVDRIERVQRAEVGRSDRQALQIANINRELGLA